MRNAERSLFGSHDENYVARSRTRLLRSGWPPARGRNDPVGQECGSGADRVDEVTTGLCGPDGAAAVYYRVPQPSTRCSSTAG